MDMRHVRALVACYLSLGLLGGCSPYVYKEEVATFNEGVTQAAAMFDTQREFMKTRAASIKRADLIAGNFPRAQLSDECSQVVVCLERQSPVPRVECTRILADPRAKPRTSLDDQYARFLHYAEETCQLQFADGKSIAIAPQAIVQRQVLTALSEYASALAGIVNAADREALMQSTTKVCGSAQALFVGAKELTLVDDGGGADEAAKQLAAQKEAERKARINAEGTVVNSVCGLVSQGGAAFLDRERLKVLTQVVNDADPIVQTLAAYLQQQSRRMSVMLIRASLNGVEDALVDTIGATEGTEDQYFSGIANSIAAQEKLTAVLHDTPEGVFARMAVAHRALKDAVNDPATQVKSAIAAIQAFQQSAKQAYDAVKALSKPVAQ
jgi:hypothetical protein